LPGLQAKASIDVKTELVPVRNVVGIIRSDNPAGTILLGAHYDHLGKRNQTIYNGADDNASGVAGLLGLSKIWGRADATLPCNLVFAAWTGEEKGLLGSAYFVNSRKPDPDDYLLAVNMDMISRSVPEDTAGRIVSIGTLPSGENLRQIAREVNLKNNLLFNLDLWDVTGHTGSDYASFTAAEIPVMTFFSGFHNDYHSERDDAALVDLRKMGKVLQLVNETIIRVMEGIR
jgi:Zn-dependent M28 family amino/carboxypeptidase